MKRLVLVAYILYVVCLGVYWLDLYYIHYFSHLELNGD